MFTKLNEVLDDGQFLTSAGIARTKACDVGFWGEKCENNCYRNCSCNRGCDMQTGRCKFCYYGNWGSRCTESCPNTCKEQCYYYFEFHDCSPDRMCGLACDQNTGECYSCQNGFWGGYCNSTCVPIDRCFSCQQTNGSNCHVCKPGLWGTTCEKKCSSNCLKCDKSTGNCSSSYCKRGFYGTYCENRCYISHCEKCYNSSYCTGCEYGYWGPRCSICADTQCDICNHITGKCEICKNGYWGNRCQFLCKSGCAEDCDKLTAKCSTCKAGYWGESCNNSCKLDHCTSFGDCSKEYGPVCYQCDPDRWGYLCENECSSNCTNGCMKSTGDCYMIQKEYMANDQLSETTIIGISIGTSLSVVSVFIVAGVLLFRFCYTRIEAKVEKKLAAQRNCINKCTDKQKTVKGFDNPLDPGSHTSDDLYEIPVKSTATTGRYSASNYDTLHDDPYINCPMDEKV